MATIHNTDTIKRILDDAKIQTSRDDVPKQLSKVVVPVLVSNPKGEINKVIENEKIATGSLVVGTTSTTKRTYCWGYQYSFVKDGTCDCATDTTSLNLPVEGLGTTSIARLPVLTTTAQQTSITHNFKKPIKLEKGANISEVFPAYTAGLASRGVVIYCEEVDEQNA